MNKGAVAILTAQQATRAYNLVIPPMAGPFAIDPAAFYKPKRFFGAARNIEEGQKQLLLLLGWNRQRMDDVIFEEFSGTAMEMHLIESWLIAGISRFDILVRNQRKSHAEQDHWIDGLAAFYGSLSSDFFGTVTLKKTKKCSFLSNLHNL